MPVIKFNERSYVLKTIKLQCLKCSGFCETSQPHPNTAECACGKVRVDGGISLGANVYGNPWAMEDYSIYRTEDKPKIQLPQSVVTLNHDKTRENILIGYKNQGCSQEKLDEIKSGR